MIWDIKSSRNFTPPSDTPSHPNYPFPSISHTLPTYILHHTPIQSFSTHTKNPRMTPPISLPVLITLESSSWQLARFQALTTKNSRKSHNPRTLFPQFLNYPHQQYDISRPSTILSKTIARSRTQKKKKKKKKKTFKPFSRFLHPSTFGSEKNALNG